MNNEIKKHLTDSVREKMQKNDPSHDINHTLRTLALAEFIAREEKADLDIITPAALFHDVVVYQKDDPKSKHETQESAEFAEKRLSTVKGYPEEKIEKVKTAILQCSFSKQIIPNFIEAKILQDADRLEATGAISIMRTFSSCGQMEKQFYHPGDPFCEKTDPVSFRSGLDLFYERLLIVEKGMHTDLAKKIARRRTQFLKDFLDELRIELEESGVATNP